jgi:2,4-dienoyl-CoA reductase-like NADH-dependent reductase (Old Yellow Enzyme family)
VKPILHVIPDENWPTQEEAARSLWFSPLTLANGCTLHSRTWVPAMVPWRATDEGMVTQDNLDWYGRFADGQPGVLVVEATGIRDVPSGPLLRIGHDRFVDGLKRLVDTVKTRSHGKTRVFIQLIDFLSIRRRPEPQKFFERFLIVTEEHRTRLNALDPSRDWTQATEPEVRSRMMTLPAENVLNARELEALNHGARERVTDTHLPHIAELPTVLPRLFSDAARRAELAGFDGVELHYAHAYTMASFLSRLNNRTDGYGGDTNGRLRLPLDVYRACRSVLSPSTVLGCRMLAHEAIDGGSTEQDAAFYAVEFARAGMDFISLSKGGKFEDAKQPRVGESAYPYTGPSGHECMPTVRGDERGPLGRNLGLSSEIRRHIRNAGFQTPVVGAGGVVAFSVAEAALQRGDCDLVASARQSLADPDWFLKVKMGRGSEVRRCKLTNYCEALDQRHKKVTCQLWDRVPVPGEGDVPRDGNRRLTAPRWIV